MTTTSTLPPAERDGELSLPDGRTLSYTQLGDPKGPAVVVLDGPGSRGLARGAADVASRVGVRLIAPDRPGFGRSTPDPRRTISDWARDMATLADRLGLERFGILAHSGGTPYALVSAARLAKRVRAVGLLGALVPLGESDALDGVSGSMRTLFVQARHAPWALGPTLRVAALQARRDPEAAARRMLHDLPDADRAVMDLPGMFELHQRTTAEIMSAPAEVARELCLLARPWGFDFFDVRVPVELWVGERDTTHPPAMSRRLAARLHGSPVHVVSGAATFGLRSVYPAVLRFCAEARRQAR